MACLGRMKSCLLDEMSSVLGHGHFMSSLERKPLDASASLAMVLLCMVWGLQQVVFKMAADDVAPVMMVALRSGGAALLIWLVFRIVRREAWLPDIWHKEGVMAGFFFGTEFLLLSEALRWTSASHASVFLYTAPLFLAVGLHFRAPEERLKFGQTLGLVTAFVGLVIAFLVPAFLDPDATRSGQTLWGDFLAMGAGFLLGMTTLTVRTTRLKSAPPSQSLFYQLVGGAIVAFPAAWLSNQHVVAKTPLAWGSIAFHLLGVAFLSYLAWFALLRRYSANRLGVLSFLTPIFGVLLGHLTLGERVESAFIVGALLVGVGVLLVNGRDWFAPKKKH